MNGRTIIGLIAAALVTSCAAIAIVTVWSDAYPPDRPDVTVSQPIQTPPIVSVRSSDGPDQLPPYWRVNAPRWCEEDMVCWIGSAADGRPASEALSDWRRQMRIAHDDLRTIGVLLSRYSDGNPLEVDRAAISHVGHCTGHGVNRTCTARLEGYASPVYVAGVDFPQH